MGKVKEHNGKWLIDITIDGRRIRRKFPTKKDATEVLEKLTQHKTNQLKKELINEHTNTPNKNVGRRKSA